MDLATLRNIPKSKILIFDLEHTGDVKPELLQFSAVWANGHEAVNLYIRPTHAKEWKHTEPIHHITPAMVKDAPTIKDVKRLLESIFMTAKVIVGFSTRDDYRVLKMNRVFVPTGNKHIRIDISQPFNDLYCDTVEHSKKYNEKSLKVCAAYYGYHGEDWHNSMSDAMATAMCFNRMLANGDLAYVSTIHKEQMEKRAKSMQPKMKGSKTRRKKKQESKRWKEKKMNKKDY